MPDIQHSGILSADTHEPKHISDATTTDSGKVITPSSTVANTSELRSLNKDDIDNTNTDRLHLEIVANATVINFAGAPADTTLHTSTDYTTVTLFTENITVPKRGFSFNAPTGQATCNRDGLYAGELWMSVSSDAVSTLIGVRYGLNGNFFAAGDGAVLKVLAKASGDIHMMSAIAEVPLVATDVITLGIVADKASNITIHEAGLILRRVE